ncbi:MAG: uroporphyrinogen-III C-methyltransferase, partial [Myxococcota bacterium]
GDPELITLAARDRLCAADVVIADYLANPALLLWCRPECEVVQRRRGPRSDAPLPPGLSPLRQADVNAAMLRHARAGRHVVRLKGGDPCMFGRGAEEAQVLATAGIPYEIVAGVSSPIAAPGAAGIPVTHRDHTPAVTFVSGFEAYDKAGLHVAWEHLARSAGTIVLMMSVGNARDNARRLVEAGRDAATPAAMVRWGTRGMQQTIVGTLADIGDRIEAAGLRPPAVLVVGDVVALHHEIDWLGRRPLFGRRVAVTRSAEQGLPLRRALQRQGADAVPIPCLAITPPEDAGPLHTMLRRIATDFDGVILSSPNGVRATMEAIVAAGLDVRILAGKTVAVVGAATARVCREHGLQPDVVPAAARAEGLLEALSDTVSQRWLMLRADEGRAVVPDAIVAAGGRCEIAVAYRATRPPVPALLLQSMLPVEDGGEGIDAVCFASGKTARHFMETTTEAFGAELARTIVDRTKIASLGPVTTAALERMGIAVDATATEPTDAAMVDAVATALGITPGKAS